MSSTEEYGWVDMANEQLATAVKQIAAIWKTGDIDAGYDAYRTLFESADFLSYRPQDQRQALKLMVLAKSPPGQPSAAMIEAHRAALVPLTELVSTFSEPADHEMLGICHVLLGNEAAASAIFKAGLAIERERSPQSDLCGALMRRISLL
jgi:hypothetical protein